VEADRCYHCGERCVRGAVRQQGHAFCCVGCQAVFRLLTESGLGQFYELAVAPGRRVKEKREQSQWSFLDAPAVQEKLLDFADERRAKVTFHLPAIHCVACVWLLENLFRLQPGLGESRVNFARRDASVTFDRAQVKLSELAALLASLGYEPSLTLGELDRGHRQAPRRRRRQWVQIGVAGFAFGNIMLLALPGYLGLDSLSGPWFRTLAGWLSLVLALPVLLYSAGDYWRAAWFSLKQRTLTLDVPIALGLAAIYGQSAFEVMARRGEGYCDSLTGLIFFLLCGRLFQRKTFDRLAFDRDYKGFFPLAVVRKRSHPSAIGRAAEAATFGSGGEAEAAAEEESVSISQLAVGDRLLIRHGELVPADARLLSGDALVDYSFVTGEAEPVVLRQGALLYAGGRQTGGAIEVETVKPVSESYLTSLWDNEVFRKRRDDDLDSLTNRYSRRFTVGVVGVAIAAAVFWLFFDAGVAMKAFTSVLIVACPCALALAAPLTLGTAQRWLASRQIFLRNAQVIERMSEVDTVVFDKTGTLTSMNAASLTWEGAPLRAIEQNWVRSLTRHSTHPLAVRIVDAIGRGGEAPVQSFAETPGQGIEGRINGQEILMGSAAWLETHGVPPWLQSQPQLSARAASAAGRSTPPAPVRGSAVHLAVNGRYRGCFVLASVLRPEVESLVAALRGSCRLALLSGDHGRDAERFRALLGEAARVDFNQSPFDKLEAIRALQSAGHKVLMVGDGLNDAGALQQAEVGVAVVEKVGCFSPASDVILEAARLPQLAGVLAFSRRAARVVRAGFVVSGLYNIVGISIAAAGLLSPLVCAVLMPLSSATVVLFAMGATRWVARRTFRTALSETHRISASSEREDRLLRSEPAWEPGR